MKSSIGLTASGKSIRIETPQGVKTFRISGLENKLQNIMRRSTALSWEYGSTPKFPTDLGGDTQVPSFVRKQTELLDDILSGHGDKYTPAEAIKAISDIREIGGSAAGFNKAFYGAVAKYYGYPNMSVGTTITALKKGKFRVPAADVNRPRTHSERYENYIVWLLNEIPNLRPGALRDLSQAELAHIENIYNNEGIDAIPSKYKQYYTRKKKISKLYGEKLEYEEDEKGRHYKNLKRPEENKK